MRKVWSACDHEWLLLSLTTVRIGPTYQLIAECSNDEDRGRNSTILSLGNCVGFIFGAVAVAYDESWRTPLYFGAVPGLFILPMAGAGLFMESPLWHVGTSPPPSSSSSRTNLAPLVPYMTKAQLRKSTPGEGGGGTWASDHSLYYRLIVRYGRLFGISKHDHARTFRKAFLGPSPGLSPITH